MNMYLKFEVLMDFVFFVLVLERCMRKRVLINNDKVFVMLNYKKMVLVLVFFLFKSDYLL